MNRQNMDPLQQQIDQIQEHVSLPAELIHDELAIEFYKNRAMAKERAAERSRQTTIQDFHSSP